MLRLARWSMFVGTGIVVLAVGWVHATFIGFYDFSTSTAFSWDVAYVLMLAVAGYGVGLPDLPRTAYEALALGLSAGALAATGISLVQLVLGSLLLPRFVVFWSAIFVVPVWALTGFIAARDRRRQRRRERVFLIASDEDADHLRVDLLRNPERRATIAAVVDPGDASLRASQLTQLARQAEATIVVLARQALVDTEVVDQVADLHENGIRVRTLALFYEEWIGKLPLSELERVALMFDIGELHRARYGRVKRAMDLMIAAVSLPVLALAIPLVLLGNLFGNRGPLFFRQARVGRNDEVFNIWKFRTMRPDPTATGSWTQPNDERITRFGRVLRRTHLDELPQVINLIQGQLTTVGPRPEQPVYVDHLASSIRFYRLRHLVRPGLTGWAQVKYLYGDSEVDALEKLQYEFYYLRHQDLFLDLRILARTIRSVLGLQGR